MISTQAGLWILLAGIVVLARDAECLRGSALVAELKNKAKAALLNPTETVEEVVTVEGDGEGGNSTGNVTVVKTKSLLTGNPQKDYIYDPNLPRELNGYNLSSYPFYNGVPEDIDFKCDDLHDGFYASVPHKCQVYHHCLFGTRYDFLCANYTAFDQRTFICHFVSEVDCDNSPKFFQRNEALYKAAATPPIVIPTTPSTTPAPTTAATQRPRRRRPYRRRRPAYEYYYDDQYDDDEYYDDDPPPPRRKTNRKHRPQGGYRADDDDYYDGRRDGYRGEGSRVESPRGDSSRGEGGRGESARGESGSEGSKEGKPTLRVSGPASGTVYDKPRVPPKVRRPVPINERDKYDYSKKTDGSQPPQDNKKTSKPPPKGEEDDDEYYDDEYEDEYVKPLPPKRGKGGSEYSSEAASKTESRRPSSRPRPRQNSRRRPERYDDDYEEDRPVRPRKRNRYEDPPQMSRGNRGGHRGYSRDEPDPVPAERPGFISNSRYSTGNRKKTEDERNPTTKRPTSRVVYDDDEEEEDYYDDEEEEAQDDNSSKRSHKPSSQSAGSGRRNEDYEAEGGRKYLSSGRKPITDSSAKPNVRSDSRAQISGGYQGDNPRNENGKAASRLKFETTSTKRGSVTETCKKGCDDDYSDYSVDDSRQEKTSGSEREDYKQTNTKDSQRQLSERDRLFSSRFRDSVSDSKSKHQSQDPTGPGKVSSNIRSTTLNPNPSQRTKNGRIKPAIDEPRSTTTTTESYGDYSDESSTSGSKYPNFRSKGRIVPPTPLINNYKIYSTTGEPVQQEDDDSNSNKNFELESSSTEDPISSSSDKAIISPRPFSGLMRRPTKSTTESTSFDDLAISPKMPSMNVNYRQPTKVNEDDERSVRKPASPIQSYRRITTEPPQVENSEYSQQKTSYASNSFRRPVKPVEEYRPDDIPQTGGQDDAQTDENFKMSIKPSYSDKSQMSNPSTGGAYRRVKVSAIPTPTTDYESSTSSYETPQTFQGVSLTNPVSSYKRPYLGRPLSNYPVVVEETTKNTLSQNNPYMRRPVKQRFQDSEQSSGVQDYNPTSTSSGTGESYIKVEQGLGINLRPSLQYFPPKRGKLRIDDTSARGLDQYSKQININQDDQFSKQSPKLDITAPGPSAPDADVATVKSTHYNNPPSGFPLDIPEEEYDVTLNDALQPSTLHPTRSLVDYQQNRLKTRDYQSNIGRSPEYVSRGRVAYLLPAASQQYITRVQSVYSPEKQEENPVTARYTDSKSDNKATSLDQQEYEAVVLTAQNDQWPNLRRNRPTEWYW